MPCDAHEAPLVTGTLVLCLSHLISFRPLHFNVRNSGSVHIHIIPLPLSTTRDHMAKTHQG